ncbi:hypothetical protein Trydic_g11844 [Trypoxylus dichotomus]
MLVLCWKQAINYAHSWIDIWRCIIPYDIVNAFADYLSSVYVSSDNDVPRSCVESTSLVDILCITESEVHTAIRKLKNTMTSFLVRDYASMFLQLLKIIFNFILSTTVLPSLWKMAKTLYLNPVHRRILQLYILSPNIVMNEHGFMDNGSPVTNLGYFIQVAARVACERALDVLKAIHEARKLQVRSELKLKRRKGGETVKTMLYEQMRQALYDQQHNVENEAEIGRQLTDEINHLNAETEMMHQVTNDSILQKEEANMALMRNIKRMRMAVDQHESRLKQLQMMSALKEMKKQKDASEAQEFFFV